MSNTNQFMASIIRHYGGLEQYLETLDMLIDNWELELAQLVHDRHDLPKLELLISNIREALELSQLLRAEVKHVA